MTDDARTADAGVVIDTNVFVAAGFNPRSTSAAILAAVGVGRLRMTWNEAMRREMEAVLRRIPPLRGIYVTSIFRDEHRYAGQTEPGRFAGVPDPEDRKFAAMAHAAGAIVVSNDQHLLGAGPEPGLTVLTPGHSRRRFAPQPGGHYHPATPTSSTGSFMRYTVAAAIVLMTAACAQGGRRPPARPGIDIQAYCAERKHERADSVRVTPAELELRVAQRFSLMQLQVTRAGVSGPTGHTPVFYALKSPVARIEGGEVLALAPGEAELTVRPLCRPEGSRGQAQPAVVRIVVVP